MRAHSGTGGLGGGAVIGVRRVGGEQLLQIDSSHHEIFPSHSACPALLAFMRA